MIPSAYITDWGTTVGWPTDEQIEQDFVLSRLIIEIANDDYLGNELVFRGGTCLHKLRQTDMPPIAAAEPAPADRIPNRRTRLGC